MSTSILNCEALESIVDSGDTKLIASTIQDFKTHIKHNEVNLDDARSYFHILQTVSGSQDLSLQSTAHSCCCLLIKKIISQSAFNLSEFADVSIPIIIHGLGDSKPSIRASCTDVLSDAFTVCADKLDSLFKEFGLQSNDPTISLASLEFLHNRIKSDPNLSFKIYTPSVVFLLRQTETESKAASILISFFKSAKQVAKTDLSKQLTRQSIEPKLSSYILSSINYSTKESQLQNQASSSISPKKARQVSALSIDFYLKDPRYELEDLTSEECSPDDLYLLTDRILPSFEGKETEFNWKQRESHIMQLRCILRGNIPQENPDDFLNGFEELSSSIMKAASSLRTTLSTSSCLLIKEAFLLLGPVLDPVADYFFKSTAKFASLTKKITSSNGMFAAGAIVLKTSYNPKILQHILTSLNEKNFQPRVFAARMIIILLYAHQNNKNVIDTSGGRELIEKCITKALSDANMAVREEMRKAFWAYNELWPSHGQRVLDSLDQSLKKQLDRANPNSSIPSSTPNTTTTSTGSFRNYRAALHNNSSKSVSTAKTSTQIEETQKSKGTSPLEDISNQPGTIQLSNSQNNGFGASSDSSNRNPNRVLMEKICAPQLNPVQSCVVSRPHSRNQSDHFESTYQLSSSAVTSLPPRCSPILGAAGTGIMTSPSKNTDRRATVNSNFDYSMRAQQRLLKKISSTNPEETATGARMLIDCIMQSELSVDNLIKENFIPRHGALSQPLRMLFERQQNEVVFCKTVCILSQYPQVVSYLSKCIAPTELSIAVIYAWSNFAAVSRPNSSASFRSSSAASLRSNSSAVSRSGSAISFRSNSSASFKWVGIDAEEEALKDPLNTGDTQEIGIRVIEQLISELEPEFRLSLVTYIVSYRRDLLQNALNQSQGISKDKESISLLEDDLYANRALETIILNDRWNEIVLDSEKVDDIRLLGMYLKGISSDKKIVKLFSEIKQKLGYKQFTEKLAQEGIAGDRKGERPFSDNEVVNGNGIIESGLCTKVKLDKKENNDDEVHTQLLPIQSTDVDVSEQAGQPHQTESRQGDTLMPDYESGRDEEDNKSHAPSFQVNNSLEDEAMTSSVIIGKDLSDSDIKSQVESEFGNSNKMDPNFTKEYINSITGVTSFSTTPSSFSIGKPTTPEKQTDTGKSFDFGKQQETIIPDAGITQIEQLEKSFGSISTPSKGQEFETKLCKVDQNVHDSCLSSRSTSKTPNTNSVNTLRNDKNNTFIHEFIKDLNNGNDLESIKHYSDECITRFKANSQIFQQKELDNLILDLFRFLKLSDNHQRLLPGNLKRSLLLLIDTLAGENLFQGKEDGLIWALVRLQGNFENSAKISKETDTSKAIDLDDSNEQNNGKEISKDLESVSQTAIMTASLNTVQKLSDDSGKFFEPVIKTVETLLESYSVTKYLSVPGGLAAPDDVFITRLWFAYEALGVVCKAGHQLTLQVNARSSMKLNKDKNNIVRAGEPKNLEKTHDTVLTQTTLNMARLGKIFAAGFKIHKTMVRRSCYITLVELLGMFSLPSSSLLEKLASLPADKYLPEDPRAPNGKDVGSPKNSELGHGCEISEQGRHELGKMIVQRLDKQQIKLLIFLAEHPEAL